MDASSISAVTELSEKHVLEVMRSLGHDTEKIAAAVDQYLNSKSGPLKDGTEMADGWAESGKPRRPKKGDEEPAGAKNEERSERKGKEERRERDGKGSGGRGGSGA
jgi:hypothetical protein